MKQRAQHIQVKGIAAILVGPAEVELFLEGGRAAELVG